MPRRSACDYPTYLFSMAAKLTFETAHAIFSLTQRRRQRLGNGKEYLIAPEEFAKRSSFFEAMFREGSEFKESAGGVIELNLPDDDAFEGLWVFLLNGRTFGVHDEW